MVVGRFMFFGMIFYGDIRFSVDVFFIEVV